MTSEIKRNIVVIGMGYVGIPAAALLADVPGHKDRSASSGGHPAPVGRSIGSTPARTHSKGTSRALDELMARVVLDKKTFHVTDDYAVCQATPT